MSIDSGYNVTTLEGIFPSTEAANNINSRLRINPIAYVDIY